MRDVKEKSGYVEVYYTITPEQLEAMMGTSGILVPFKSKDPETHIQPGLFTFDPDYISEHKFSDFVDEATQAVHEETGVALSYISIKWVDPLGFVATIQRDYGSFSDAPNSLET
jgi:hypothetical protein